VVRQSDSVMNEQARSAETSLTAAVSARWWTLGMLVLCVLHVGLLIANLARVPPTHGYDWPGHLAYVQYVHDHWRAPPPEATPQFFNPPLYYFGVVVFHSVTGVGLDRSGQLLNLLLALVALILLLVCARQLWRNALLPALWFVGFYVLNPTVYRVFGMVRPEAMLVPLFVAAALLVISGQVAKARWKSFAVLSGCLAGVAFGTRQWGVFLEITFLVWLLVCFRHLMAAAGLRRAFWQCMGLQSVSFLALTALFLVIRGGNVLAFNASPQWPQGAFLTRLELPTLFSHPVRPALDFRLWPILYADFWGDYWRYWREALIHDPLPTSAPVVTSMVRSMWAALPATWLAAAGLLVRGSRLADGDRGNGRRRLHEMARILTAASAAGFVLFAALYAQPGKGDTAKSVYLVYMIPIWGWLSSAAVFVLIRALPKARWAPVVALALLVVFVAPNGVYLPPERMVARSWEPPPVSCPVNATLGDSITLIGYNIQVKPSGLAVNLVWHTDSYIGVNYKVFVHLVDVDGGLLAQSDGVPAAWGRATQSWIRGEFISDVHEIALPQAQISMIGSINVGLYQEGGRRLTTETGSDHLAIRIGEGGVRSCGE
jgi:hypothetical protein